MNLPLSYDQLNTMAGHYFPSMVKAYNNQTFAYWFRALFERACSVFEFELPEEWEGPVQDFFYFCLLRFGYVGIFDLPETGLAFSFGSFKGYNFYYQPTNFLLANPLLPDTKDLVIGEDVEILKLTPNYQGIFDIIGHYAEQLAALDNAINTTIINSKISFFLFGRNKAAIEALKKAMDKFYKGEPAVYLDSKLQMDRTDKEDPFIMVERSNLKSNFIAPDQLECLNTILNNFDKEIGIPTTPYQKAERMTQYESESQMLDATARCITWKKTIDSSLKRVNKLFPDANIKCEFRYVPDQDPSKVPQVTPEGKAGDSNGNS